MVEKTGRDGPSPGIDLLAFPLDARGTRTFPP